MEPLVQNALEGNIEQLAWRLTKPQPQALLDEAMHRACQVSGNPSQLPARARAVELLLEQGANPDVEDKLFGSTPLHAAINAHAPTLVQQLLEAGCRAHLPEFPLKRNLPAVIQAAYEGQVAILELLLSYKASVFATGAAGRTALSYAAEGNHLEMVDHLIRRGLSLNFRNGIGNTVIHDFPCYSPQMVDHLLDKGASLDLSDFQGKSIEELAHRGDTPTHRHMRFILASRVADTLSEHTAPVVASARKARI